MPGSNAMTASTSTRRNRRHQFVRLEAGSGSNPVMRKERDEGRIALEEGQDVESRLTGSWARDDDPLGHDAGEVSDRLGDDLPPQRRELGIRIAPSLIVDDRDHHPEPVVARRVSVAALQGDRPGNGRFRGQEPHRLPRSEARDGVRQVEIGQSRMALLVQREKERQSEENWAADSSMPPISCPRSTTEPQGPVNRSRASGWRDRSSP